MLRATTFGGAMVLAVLALTALDCGGSSPAGNADGMADHASPFTDATLSPDEDFTTSPECDAFCSRLTSAACPAADGPCDRVFWCGLALRVAACRQARRDYLDCASQGTFECVTGDGSSGIDIRPSSQCLLQAVASAVCADGGGGG
jgi:hypothetical protein